MINCQYIRGGVAVCIRRRRGDRCGLHYRRSKVINATMGRRNNVVENSRVRYHQATKEEVARIRQLLTHITQSCILIIIYGGRWSSRAADAAGPSPCGMDSLGYIAPRGCDAMVMMVRWLQAMLGFWVTRQTASP
eukprot:scaffold1577_cov79-Skeletonema_dohrnii-CCMP3373.AAC.1